MKYDRIYNFSAGPAMMPEPVLEEIRDEMLNYQGSGMCVMEMSHRSKVYQQIIDEAEQDLRDLMNIPDNYKVLFIQGGATLQFAMIPMNLMKNGVACYVETGAWSKKAIAEAKKYGDVHVVASSKDRNYSYVPDCSNLDIPENADYVYICENETIHGVTWNKLPDTKGHIQGKGTGGNNFQIFLDGFLSHRHNCFFTELFCNLIKSDLKSFFTCFRVNYLHHLRFCFFLFCHFFFLTFSYL